MRKPTDTEAQVFTDLKEAYNGLKTQDNLLDIRPEYQAIKRHFINAYKIKANGGKPEQIVFNSIIQKRVNELYQDLIAA